MAEHMGRATVDDVLVEEKLDSTHFAQWIFEGNVRELKALGIDRVLSSLYSLAHQKGLAYLAPSKVAQTELGNAYAIFGHEIKERTSVHRWEQPLLVILKQCGFIEPEIRDTIRSSVGATPFNSPADRTVMENAFNNAARGVGMRPFFGLEE